LLIVVGYMFTKTEHHDTYPAIDPLKLDLKGKKVLLTGAARGIGLQLAISFAKGGVSAIALVDILEVESTARDVIQAADYAKRPRPEIIQLKADVTDVDQVQQAAQHITNEWQSVDILINNAGYLAPYRPIGDSDPEKWWRNFEVNVKGVYLIARAFLPLLLQSNDKTIIVLTSLGALQFLPGGSGYETTKLAVLKLNNYLMAEYGSKGLLAYGVAPGGVMTELAKGFLSELQHLATDTPQMAADTIAFLAQERREWLGARYVDARWDMVELLEKKTEIVERDLLKLGLRL
jgi:NAD(P)-dependent dehydrogenase (short-subunit alcohol dehydrogenase family)